MASCNDEWLEYYTDRIMEAIETNEREVKAMKHKTRSYTESERNTAVIMRAAGKTNEEIGLKIGVSAGSIAQLFRNMKEKEPTEALKARKETRSSLPKETARKAEKQTTEAEKTVSLKKENEAELINAKEAYERLYKDLESLRERNEGLSKRVKELSEEKELLEAELLKERETTLHEREQHEYRSRAETAEEDRRILADMLARVMTYNKQVR